MAQDISLGRIQGAGFWTGTPSAGNPSIYTITTPSTIAPMVGDIVVRTDGGVSPITAVSEVASGSVQATLSDEILFTLKGKSFPTLKAKQVTVGPKTVTRKTITRFYMDSTDAGVANYCYMIPVGYQLSSGADLSVYAFEFHNANCQVHVFNNSDTDKNNVYCYFYLLVADEPIWES